METAYRAQAGCIATGVGAVRHSVGALAAVQMGASWGKLCVRPGNGADTAGPDRRGQPLAARDGHVCVDDVIAYAAWEGQCEEHGASGGWQVGTQLVPSADGALERVPRRVRLSWERTLWLPGLLWPLRR